MWHEKYTLSVVFILMFQPCLMTLKFGNKKCFHDHPIRPTLQTRNGDLLAQNTVLEERSALCQSLVERNENLSLGKAKYKRRLRAAKVRAQSRCSCVACIHFFSIGTCSFSCFQPFVFANLKYVCDCVFSCTCIIRMIINICRRNWHLCSKS